MTTIKPLPNGKFEVTVEHSNGLSLIEIIDSEEMDKRLKEKKPRRRRRKSNLR